MGVMVGTSSACGPAAARALLSCVAAAVLWTTLALPAFAEATATPPGLARKHQFEDWEGVAVYCSAVGRALENQALCDWAGERMRALGKLARIPVLVTQNDPLKRAQDKARAQAPNALDLELVLDRVDGASSAVAVTLRAKSYYGSAVEGQTWPSDPRRKTKAGDLVFWETRFVGVGSRGPDFEAALRRSLDQQLTRFVTEFSDARS